MLPGERRKIAGQRVAKDIIVPLRHTLKVEAPKKIGLQDI